MTIKIYDELIQGSDEWFSARLGLLTASEMKHILTPAKLKYSSSEKERTHLYELAAQRIANYVEPTYFNDDMERGNIDEIRAIELYSEKYAPVRKVGFITNDRYGFTLGCSPDGLVGDDGGIECKSRKQKYQVQTFIDGGLPDAYSLQVQTLLLVSERKWWDFISFCGGFPMYIFRVYPDAVMQDAIKEAAMIFHGKLDDVIEIYNDRIIGFHPTERIIYDENLIITDSEDGDIIPC